MHTSSILLAESLGRDNSFDNDILHTKRGAPKTIFMNNQTSLTCKSMVQRIRSNKEDVSMTVPPLKQTFPLS